MNRADRLFARVPLLDRKTRYHVPVAPTILQIRFKWCCEQLVSHERRSKLRAEATKRGRQKADSSTDAAFDLPLCVSPLQLYLNLLAAGRKAMVGDLVLEVRTQEGAVHDVIHCR